MSKQKLTDAMVEAINMGVLRKAVKALNDAKVLDEKLKVAGLDKQALAMAFTEAIEATASDAEKAENIPADCVEFYNGIWEGGADAAPTDKKAAKKDAKKTDKKAAGPKRTFSNFDELKEHLKTPPNPTQVFDKLCIKGAKIETLIAQLAKEHPDYKSLSTKSAVMAHVKYRQNRGYVYEVDEDKVKLVGFTPKS